MNMSRDRFYEPGYEELCFDAWYLAGKPNQPARIQEVCPNSSDGRKPSAVWFQRKLQEWIPRANDLDLQVAEENDKKLIKSRVAILEKQQKDAMILATKALEYLKVDGFDSSSSAVQAYFRATEEIRKTAGFSNLLEELENMSDNQVRDHIISLVQRATDNNQVVEGDTTDIAGELDTVSTDNEE
jgi:hypothetical protein